MASAGGIPEENSGSTEENNSSNFDFSVTSLGRLFAVTFAVHTFSYLLGSYNFSFAWILFAIAMFVLREKYRRDHRQVQMSLRAISQNPNQILARFQDLPSWVHFPDVEKAEWLNKIVKQLWPYIGGYVRSFIKEKIEPSIQKSLQKSLKITSFSFESIDLGDIPPRIGGVKVYGENVSRKEIIMDLDVYYAGDCKLSVSVRRIKAGLEAVHMRGTLRVVMKPLVNKIPLVGGLQVFFLNRPMIDFNLTNLMNVLDIPGLADVLRTTVVDQVSKMMVLPNKLPIKLMADLPTSVLEMPEPAGVLRINVIGARELMNKDASLMGMGKSDPYAVITVGNEEFKTKVVDNSVDPVWDYYCEVIVFCAEGQVIEVTIYDDDSAGNDDDFLGRATVDIQTVIAQGSCDMWVALDDAKTGTVHLDLSWFTLSSSEFELHQAMKDSSRVKEHLSSAVLIAYVDCAKNLPNSGKIGIEPSPFVRLTMANRKHETKTCPNTNDPVWEKGFCFLVQNLEAQDLSVDVIDQKCDKQLGELSFTLRQLLKEPKWTLHRPLPLKSSNHNCEITLLLKLQAFHAVKVEDSKTASVVSRELPPRRVDSVSSGRMETSTPSNQSPVLPRDDSLEQGSGDGVNPQNGTITCATVTSLESIPPDSNTSETDVTLRRRIIEPSADSRKAKLQLTMRYSVPRQKLVVVVHRAVNVPCLGSGEAPDPYVKLYLQADQSRDSKRKTASAKSSCKPIFDETFEYTIAASDLENQVVEASVCARSSSSLFGRSITLGRVAVNLTGMDLNQATTEWYDLEESKPEDL